MSTSPETADPENLVRRLFDGFAANDLDGIRKLMAEVHAARNGRTLHNFATHLLTFRMPEGLIAEWWMVEALPAESDRFWST